MTIFEKITVYLSTEDKKTLRVEAATLGLSLTAYLRQIITERKTHS